MNILVVDDREEGRYLLEVLLKGSGHAVTGATNGQEALERLQSGRFDLIISDILMPVMDGFQLCRKVKADEALRHIPFIVYTATYTGPQDEAFAIKIGADRFIQKPCDPDALMETVQDVMAAVKVRGSAPAPPPVHEEEMLKLYSERLVRKLEQKMLDLEGEVQARREAEEALRASERKYRLLAENTLDVIWAMDMNLVFTYVNPAIQPSLGYSPEEWVGSRLPEHCDEKNFAEMSEVLAAELAKGSRSSGVILEVVLLNRNGEPIPFEVHGKVNFDEKGDPVALQGTARDISERKQAENALKESEKKYRELYDFLPIPVYEMDFEANITSANRAVYDTFRGTQEDLEKGFKGWQLLSSEGVAKSAENIQRLLKGEKIPGTEYELRRLDGSTFPAIIISSVIYRDDKAVGLRGAIIDITERKKQEEELRRANAFLDSIVENIPNMVFLKDARDLRFVRLNRAGEDLLGHSRDDLLRKNDYDFFPKEQADFFTEKDQDVLRRKEPMDIPEELMQTRNKGDRILHTKKVPILDEKGEPEYLLGISEDITEHKRAEAEREKLQAQLHQAQKMESVGRLAGGVAHDFNNLLTVILGYGDMALQDLDPNHPHHSLLSQIRDAGNRATNLTRQLLAFSRKQVLEMQVADLNSVVIGFEKLMRRVIGEDVLLKMSVHGDPVRVKADVSQLEQVLMNLAVNARDAMPDGGVLAIETAIVDLDEAYCSRKLGVVPGPYAMIAVADTGVGMDSGTLNQIFDPFFTTKDSDRGTGLGLATSYGIVKQHGGDIWVYSEPGQGTTFKVYLPLALEEEETEPTVIERPRPVKGTGTVLVVEDDPSVLRLAGEFLRASGYKVLEASTPEIALERARGHGPPIDLVLADVILPGMKGPEMVERIGEIHPRARVLYMSGYAEDLIAHNGILAKGIMFLPKPFTAEALREKVTAALGQP